MMQQKNIYPQDHEQAEGESSISAIRSLNAKFFTALPHSSRAHPPVGRGVVRQSGEQLRVRGDNFSTMSMLDEGDILFLSEFEKQEERSQFFALTANKREINYTESLVIHNQNTATNNDESFLEESQPILAAFTPTNSSQCSPLKKESEVKFDNGGVFKGELKNGKMINGTFVLDSMFTYQGQLSNDKFHGNGTLSFVNGHVITCNWHQGRPVGHVTITYPRGQRYEGEFINFRKHGVGCLYFNDGSRYVGEFKDGEITGQGCYYSAGREEQRGWWMKGEFLGNVGFKNCPQAATRSRGRTEHHRRANLT